MQLLVRSLDGSLTRPGDEGPFPDFNSPDSGPLLFVDADIVSEVGIYVMAGDDTDPPTHYRYEAELYAWAGGLAVRVIQKTSTTRLHIGARPEVIEWSVSEDGGRSWRAVESPPALDQSRPLDRIKAG